MKCLLFAFLIAISIVPYFAESAPISTESVSLTYPTFVFVGKTSTLVVVLGGTLTADVTITLSTVSNQVTFDGHTTFAVLFPAGTTTKSINISGLSQHTTTLNIDSSDTTRYSSSTQSLTVYHSISLSLSSPTVALGDNVTITATLSAPPSGNIALTLTSESDVLSTRRLGAFVGGTHQLRLTIFPSETTKLYVLTTTVAESGTIKVSTGGLGTTGEAGKYKWPTTAYSIPLTVLRLVNLTLSSATAAVDSDVIVTVMLSTATANGLTVTLSTTLGTFNSGAAVTIAAGQSTGTITLTTSSTTDTASITGAVSGTDAALYIANAKPTTLQLLEKVTLSLSATTADVGSTVTVSVFLSAETTSGLIVTLASTPPFVSFTGGSTVTILPGQGSATKTLTLTSAASGQLTGTVSGAPSHFHRTLL